jgi:hypothetical protein
MISTPRLRHAAALLSGLLAACSSRAVPSAWPEAAAASSEAAEAPAAEVTRALESHPPLPGEASPGWAGLAEAAPATDAHAGHQHEASYTCPMHPDVISERPGQCPRCGMNLVKRDAPK